MVKFPDLASYRLLLVDDRPETTAVVAEVFALTGASLVVAGSVDVAMHLLRKSPRPDIALIATSIAGGPFGVVEAAQRDGIPIVALDLGSTAPEISERMAHEYAVPVLRTVDDPEALCRAVKRAADEAEADT